jgi:hypothetical protein
MPADAARRPRLCLVLAAVACVHCGSSSPGAAASDAGTRDATAPVDASADAGDASPASDVGAPPPADAGDAAPAPSSTKPSLLLPAAAFYPRAIALADGSILASVVAAQSGGGLGATFLESDDDAVSFHVVGAIDDPRMQTGLCCGTLYELPRAIGALPAGALLWAASIGQGQSSAPMSIAVWVSTDRARTWTFSSNAVVASAPYNQKNGLWEPEFSMLDDGTLVCHYSDETDPAHSQKLARVRSSDGVTWGSAQDTVAPTDWGTRPGMANVRRPTGGPFIMSYEVCGGGAGCGAHMRTSTDGWSWGAATDVGAQPQTVDGIHFAHAPTLAWTASPGSMGRLFLMGQVTVGADGGIAAQDGDYLLASPQQGNQFWYALPAPVPVPTPDGGSFCPNYSSPILPLDNGTFALEIASMWDGSTCRSYFARGPLTGTGDRSGVADGGAYRFVSTMSGLCLDVAGASTDAGGTVDQTTCSGVSAESWRATDGVGQTVTLRAQNSGMCLSYAGDAAAAATRVVQLPCDGSGAQSWTVENVGLGYYVFAQPDAGTCLDVAGGSTAPGGFIEVWTCNALAPQIWYAEPE